MTVEIDMTVSPTLPRSRAMSVEPNVFAQNQRAQYMDIVSVCIERNAAGTR